MVDDDLAWTVEQACLNAWPCPRQAVIGQWLVRAAGGPSRRLNSVNPLRAPHYDPTTAIAAAAPLYAARGQPLVFRVPAIATGLGAALAARGFEVGSETVTLFTPLDARAPDPGVDLSGEPTPGWLALRAALNGGDAVAGRVVDAVIAGIALPKMFAAVRSPDGLAAIALGCVDRGMLVLEAVGTEPSMRGRGFGRRAVAALMGWAQARGAHGACLQVVADNTAGRALYDRLGFHTDLYHYLYWSAPAGG
jgi:GNAT superfamily N-acetyltransferase